MIAELKDMHSPDVDLSSYSPVNPDNFAFVLEVDIGLENSGGVDIFQFYVCTPNWLYEKYKLEAPVLLQNTILVMNYNLDEIRNTLIRLIQRCPGDSWDQIARKISKFGGWEFENYVA